MNLTDRQRKFLFIGLVVALAAIGIYLTLPSDGGTTDQARQSGSPAPAASAAPTSTPSGIDSTVTPEKFDIYRLLPFSQREFATAADMAQRFTATYGTYRFDEDPRVYVGRLSGMVTDQLRTEIVRSSSSPGLLDERRQQQVVAVSTATLDGIRDIEANSIIFLVTGKQHVTKSGKKTDDNQQYAVTVSRDGGSWRVYAFEPADAGQAGDTG